MPKKIRVYPYKQGSASTKKLAETLGGKVLKLVGSKFKPKVGDVVINWGASNLPDFRPATVLNKDVTVAQCKLASFQALAVHDVRIPQTYTDRAAIPADAFPVVCRTKLRGHSGDGIVIASKPEELVEAPLYTKYVKKKDEYRVHIVRDSVCFVQRKARKLDVEQPNWQVRNLAGGFCFAEVLVKENFERYDHRWDCPGDVLDQALDGIKALNLDFGGVDVLWNEHEGKAYVLEINTACGLEDRTAERYRDAMADLI